MLFVFILPSFLVPKLFLISGSILTPALVFLCYPPYNLRALLLLCPYSKIELILSSKEVKNNCTMNWMYFWVLFFMFLSMWVAQDQFCCWCLKQSQAKQQNAEYAVVQLWLYSVKSCAFLKERIFSFQLGPVELKCSALGCGGVM